MASVLIYIDKLWMLWPIKSAEFLEAMKLHRPFIYFAYFNPHNHTRELGTTIISIFFMMK